MSRILTLDLGDRSHCVWGIGVNDAAFCRCLLMILYHDSFLQKKRTNIVVTRHDFWAQNVPKMLLRPGLHFEARWGWSFPDPLASRQGMEGEEEGKWKVER